MASKSFYFQVVIRVLFITLASTGVTFTLMHYPLYLSFILFFILIQQVFRLIQFINKNNRKIGLLLDSLKNEDFTLKFAEDIPNKSSRELNKKINDVNKKIQEVFLANRSQEAYFKEVLEQVPVGILNYNEKGHVLFANSTVKSLFSCEKLNHIRQLEPLNSTLFELLSSPSLYGQKLFEISNERESKQLSLKSSSFKSPEGSIYLLTVQDIRTELEGKETDSWIRLIKVMTHEIMNMITPITSITATLLDNYKLDDQLVSAEFIDNSRIANTVKGLEVIRSQGQDLMNFIQSYRGFLNVSMPKKEVVLIKDLFDTLKILFSKDCRETGVILEIDINPQELQLFIDRQQILQVLVNLCKNAIQSIANAEKPNGHLRISTGVNEEGNNYIEVRDNGPGIDSELIDHIFVPFFTTKKSGSGIGLSLSKQILRLHGGNLRVHSIPNHTTYFYLIF